MHRKVTEFLTLFEPQSSLAVGEGGTSYLSGSDNSITNIRIYGNTSESGNPTPGASNWSSSYPMTLKIHKKNLMSGEEFASLISNLSCEDNMIDYYDGRINYYIFDPYGDVVSRSNIAFKENTRYTITFRFRSGSYDTAVGLKFSYTDGTEEVLHAPSATEECTVHAVSQSGKTLAAISSSEVSDSYIFTDRFGIFEGEVSDEEFEPFEGQMIDLSGTDSLTSGVINGITYRDTLDIAKGTLTKYFENITPRYSSSFINHSPTNSPKVYGLNLQRKVDLANHNSSFTGFTYYETLALLKKNEYGYTFTSDGKQVLFTFGKSFSSTPKSYFGSNLSFLQYKLETNVVKKINPVVFSEIKKGFVGVSLACEVMPHTVKVNYKK